MERRVSMLLGSVIHFASAARRDPSSVAVWPFLLAGALAGGLAELVNAQFLVTQEFLAALLTGTVIGFAHWAALRSWLRLTERRAA